MPGEATKLTRLFAHASLEENFRALSVMVAPFIRFRGVDRSAFSTMPDKALYKDVIN